MKTIFFEYLLSGRWGGFGYRPKTAEAKICFLALFMLAPEQKWRSPDHFMGANYQTRGQLAELQITANTCAKRMSKTRLNTNTWGMSESQGQKGAKRGRTLECFGVEP